jgi:hypothetical protein
MTFHAEHLAQRTKALAGLTGLYPSPITRVSGEGVAC